MAEKRHIQHLRSKVVEGGMPKLPEANSLLYGELAINYAKGYETISLKNDSGDVVSFHDEVEIINGGEPTSNNVEIVIDTSQDVSTVIYTKEQVDSQISGLTNDINGIKEVNNTQDDRLDAIEEELPNKANNNDLNTLSDKVNAISSVTSGMSVDTIAEMQEEISGKANESDLGALEDSVEELSSLTETKLSTNVYEAYTASTNDVISGIQSDVEKKLEISDFNAYSADTKEAIDGKADKARFEAFSSNTETALGKTFGAVAYDSNSKRINFYNKSTSENVIGYIDASVFVVDGMVQNVEIKEISGVSYLVVSFNTDAGKNDINIPIDSIFDADNYYTKDETNGAISSAIATYSGTVDVDLTEINEKVNAMSGDVETLSAKTDNLIVIGDSATTLSTDTELFVDEDEPTPYDVYTKAQVDSIVVGLQNAIADLQRQIDELKS